MAKEKAPAFQVYAADYLSDLNTMLMTPEEEGCYWRLMLICWREFSLPTDPEALRVLCKGVSPSDRVRSCFYETDGRLRHKRLDEERIKQEEFRESKSKAGRKGNTIRWKQKQSGRIAQRSHSDDSAIANASQTIALQSSSSTSTSPVTNTPLIPQGGNGKRPQRAVLSRRAPEDFAITADMREWANLKAPSVDVDRETEKFKNYEFRTAHSDWSATWRNWVLTAAERTGGSVAGRPAQVSFVEAENERLDRELAERKRKAEESRCRQQQTMKSNTGSSG